MAVVIHNTTDLSVLVFHPQPCHTHFIQDIFAFHIQASKSAQEQKC